MLTVARINALKPRAKPYKVHDGKGLYLLVTPGGSKLWRFRYSFAGRAGQISLGSYPETGLAKARAEAEDHREQLRRGADPSAERRRRKTAESRRSAGTFDAVAREWLSRRDWVPRHRKRVGERLRNHILPYLGDRPVGEIEPVEILEALRRIEARGRLETARRVRQTISQVIRYGIATGKARSDPTRDLRGALKAPTRRNFAAPTDPKRIGEILRALDSYSGTFAVCCAIRLAPLLFVRPGELRRMEWVEIDFGDALWTIPPEKTKTRLGHLVPLARQALEILESLRPVTGAGRYVLPGISSPNRPVSDMALTGALRRLGIPGDELVTHGWRAVASTTLNEMGWHRDAIERQLGHTDRHTVRGTYNRAQYLEERRRMMAAWADHLDALRVGAKVVPFRRRG